MKNYGATFEEWAAFRFLGVEQDMLPVVSDPNVKVSPNSKIQDIGKIPSLINSSNHVIGFVKWTEHRSTASEIDRWQRDARLGISIATRRLRAIDIDIDDPAMAQKAEDTVTQILGLTIPCRLRCNSGKRLLLLEVEGEIKKSILKTPHGRIELLASGQHFVAAGTHTSGVRYEWRAGLPKAVPKISEVELQRCWAELRRLLDSPGNSMKKPIRSHTFEGGMLELNMAKPWVMDRHVELVTAKQVLELLDEALTHLNEDEADDYDQWIRVGMSLKSLEGSCSPEERTRLEDLWHDFSQISGRYAAEQADTKWGGFEPDRIDIRYFFGLAHQNGWRALDERPIELKDLTDAHNLNILADMANQNLRFIAEERCWMYWDGIMWNRDPNNQFAQMLALQVSNKFESHLTDLSIDADLSDPISKSTFKGLTNWLRHCRSRRGVEDMLKLASSDSRFLISAGDLDNAKELLGVKNGVVDLRTGLLRAAAREDYITVYSPYAYSKGEPADRWVQFIAEITGEQDKQTGAIRPRTELATYLQRFIGYCLTGYTREHKMFIARGEGANGKNVLFDTIHDVFRGLVRNAPP